MIEQLPTPMAVQALRRDHDMTAEDFGALVYASAASVNAWEAGRRNCPPAAWELLLIYFGRAEPRRLKVKLSKAQARDVQQEVQQALRGLDALRRSLAEHMAETTKK